VDKVTLGRTGLRPTLLGMGTGTVGGRRESNQTRLGMEAFARLFRYGFERGITFCDVADQYGSHLYLRHAIRGMKGLKRENLFIMTKTRAPNAAVLRADIDRFLQELDIGYIDVLLMHCMVGENWQEQFKPVMEAMLQAKESKKIRAVGISNHGMESLQAAMKCDWIEVNLCRINHVGGLKAYMDGPVAEVVPCLRSFHEQRRGVIGMKIMGEGRFRTLEQRRQSLRYVLGLGCVDAFTIGFESTEQIDEVMKTIEEILKG
jgi:aryl-alcohol dehydrogenase-like predicted oxidoreductase